MRVLDVSCGSGDAQTLAVTDSGSVYSWGDGDYGKLGRGGSDGSKVPKLIDKLQVRYIFGCLDYFCKSGICGNKISSPVMELSFCCSLLCKMY